MVKWVKQLFCRHKNMFYWFFDKKLGMEVKMLFLVSDYFGADPKYIPALWICEECGKTFKGGEND